MDIRALKLQLIALILENDNTDLLKKFLVELYKERDGIVSDLVEEQKKEIEISRKEVKNGETESWETIFKNFHEG